MLVLFKQEVICAVATIYDIAEMTGLSPATVSRVLSGKKTSIENNRKVMDAARTLNYHNIAYVEQSEDRAMRRMVQNKTILLIPARAGTDGSYAAAQTLGYSIQLISPENLSLAEQNIRRLLLSGDAVGLITSAPMSEPFLNEISGRYPVVLLASSFRSSALHQVWIDPLSAAVSMIREFESLGRRRLWYLNALQFRNQITSEAIRQMCAEHSSISHIEEVDITETFFSQAMADHIPIAERILETPKSQRPDALLVGNSVVASCLVNLLRIRGIRVPEDIAVASMIGGEHDRACVPYLTSIVPPYYELGYEAVRILDNLVCGKLVPNHVTYPHRIHYGGSTRPTLGDTGEMEE